MSYPHDVPHDIPFYHVIGTKHYELEGYTFEDFKLEHGKSYSASENELRRNIFERNLHEIITHNSHNKAWKIGVNKFTDLTEKELKQHKGYHKAEGFAQKSSHHSGFAGEVAVKRSLKQVHELPTHVDWREAGVVSAVKNQGHCGSCWAFASTATLESHVAINTGLLFDLSSQQITSCAPNPKECGGTGGCSGATTEIAMQSVLDLGGIAEEWSYSYASFGGADQACQLDGKLQVATIDGFHVLPQNDHLALMNAVATVGPIAITVDASSWSAYESGVFNGCNQTNPELDHAVVLVGYGTDVELGDYWLVRNSWSPTWGEKGYIRLKRFAPVDEPCGTDINPADGIACKGAYQPQHVCGTCGMLFDSAYPLGANLKYQPKPKPHP